MKFLQLLIGGLYDALANDSETKRYLDAISLACFGLFPNAATIIVIVASGVACCTPVKGELLSFSGSKVLWFSIMAAIFVLLFFLRDKILYEGRARFYCKNSLKVFLGLYYVLSYVALIGASILYSNV